MARIGWAALCVSIFAIIMFLVVTQASQKKDRLALSTVKVLVNGGHGSAVHVGNRYLVTAAHVVKGQTQVQIKTSRGGETWADVLWVNDAQDIALLRAHELHFMSASRLSCGVPEVGQHITAVGNPGPLEFITAYGQVSSGIGKNDRWADFYIASMAVAPGMSGGPVLDSRGAVIGIVVGVALTQIGWGASAVALAYIAPASVICSLTMRTA